jgi:CRISPR-associated protein Cas2
MVFFDLPTTTVKDGQEYRRFHKFLIKNGFIMTQYSVYSKLVLNQGAANSVKKLLKKAVPANGLVQVLQVTEPQFASIEYLAGKAQTKIIDSDSRCVEIE